MKKKPYNIKTVKEYREALSAIEDVATLKKRGEEIMETVYAFQCDHPDEFFTWAQKLKEASAPEQCQPFSIARLNRAYRDACPGVTLQPFTGELSIETYGEWLKKHADPAIRLSYVLNECRPFVYKGLWSLLKGQDDLSEDGDLRKDVDELAAQVFAWAARNLDSLFDEGNAAKATTRLYAYARNTVARTWLTTRLRFKKKFVNGLDLDREAVALRSEGWRDEAAERANPPVPGLMYCCECKIAKSVSSTSGEGNGTQYKLDCGHTRASTVSTNLKLAAA